MVPSMTCLTCVSDSNSTASSFFETLRKEWFSFPSFLNVRELISLVGRHVGSGLGARKRGVQVVSIIYRNNLEYVSRSTNYFPPPEEEKGAMPFTKELST